MGLCAIRRRVFRFKYLVFFNHGAPCIVFVLLGMCAKSSKKSEKGKMCLDTQCVLFFCFTGSAFSFLLPGLSGFFFCSFTAVYRDRAAFYGLLSFLLCISGLGFGGRGCV